jgi:phosphate transport system ATP-binding protein
MEMNAAADLKPNVVPADTGLAIDTSGLNLWYGNFQALFDVNLQIKKGRVTSLIGPSGCGKSTFLRSINRINERLGYVTINGSINVFGNNIYAPEVELVQVRKQVGMVFQRPNPLRKYSLRSQAAQPRPQVFARRRG